MLFLRSSTRLTRPVFHLARISSSTPINNDKLSDLLPQHSAPTPTNVTEPLKIPTTIPIEHKPARRPDPAADARKAARLAREAAQAKFQVKREAAKASGKGSNNAKPSQDKRKPSIRDRVQRAGKAKTEASQSDAAAAIMALTAKAEPKNLTSEEQVKSEAKQMEKEADRVLEEGLTIEYPEFLGPEPVATNLQAIFKTTPNIVSALPPVPASFNISKRKKQVSLQLIKSAYGGDYSAYESKTQDYLLGSQGPKSAYAKVILERNRTIPLKGQQRILEIVKRGTRENTPAART